MSKSKSKRKSARPRPIVGTPATALAGRGPNERINANPNTHYETSDGADGEQTDSIKSDGGHMEFLIGLIATGGFDGHLSAIQVAITERHRQRQRGRSNQASAQIDIGDRVILGNDIRPLYLRGATGTVTGWASQNVIVQLDGSIGRFGTGQLRCPPLGLRPLRD